MIIASIILLGILLTISIVVIIYCIKLIGLQSEKIEVYEDWIIEFKEDVNKTYKDIKELDSKEIFCKDDDVGMVFKDMVNIIEKLDERVK